MGDLPPLDPPVQQVHGHQAQLLLEGVDGGEGRVQHLAHGDVVEADHRHVVGHVAAVLLQHPDGGGGDDVVVGEEGVGQGRAALEPGVEVLEGPLGGDVHLDGGGQGETGLVQGGPDPPLPLVQVADALLGLHVADAAVAGAQQQLCRRLEIAAVHQGGSIAGAVVLVGPRLTQHDKRVVLVTGDPPDAAHRLHPGAQGGAVDPPLLDMAPVKGDQLQVGAGEVQAGRGGPAQPDRGLPAVDNPGGPGDEVAVLQYAVEQLHSHLGGGVLQGDHQGVGLLGGGEEGGQSLQGIFPRLNPGVHIPEIGHVAAVGQLQLQRRIDEVLDTTTLADMAEDYKQQRLHIQTLENHTEVRG